MTNAGGARGGGDRFSLLTAVLALGIFAALVGYMRHMDAQARLTPWVQDQMTSDLALRPLAQVQRSVSTLQLVTVLLDTRVTSARSNDSWLGDVNTSVSVPLRLYFGTDMSDAKVEAAGIGPVTATYIVRVSPPRRLATEVLSGNEVVEMSVGWGRFRSTSGEYYLGLARQGVYEAARAMTLTAEDAKDVRERTRDRVGALVKTMLNGGSAAGAGERDAAVRVIFTDE